MKYIIADVQDLDLTLLLDHDLTPHAVASARPARKLDVVFDGKIVFGS
jgi:hypothetical protein